MPCVPCRGLLCLSVVPGGALINPGFHSPDVQSLSVRSSAYHQRDAYLKGWRLYPLSRINPTRTSERYIVRALTENNTIA